MKLLHIDSSILGDGSVSRALTASIVAAEKARHPSLEVVSRDLAARPVGHLTGAHLAAGQGVVPEDPALAADIVDGAALLDDFLAADMVVVGAPMYNFSIPSQLKAWIDRLAQAGRTFKYTDKGPVGLAGGKTVIVASTRGGVYSTSEGGQAMEHQESYLKVVFGFFGITDVRFVRAEGVAMGPDAKAAALASANVEISTHTSVAANQGRVSQAA